MARATLVKTSAPGSYPTDGVAVTFAAANATDKEQFVMTGNDLLIARNDGVGAATVTIDAVQDSQGRTKSITADSIAAGAIHVYGPFKELEGWNTSAGYLTLEASAADIKFAVIALPLN